MARDGRTSSRALRDMVRNELSLNRILTLVHLRMQCWFMPQWVVHKLLLHLPAIARSAGLRLRAWNNG